MKSELLESRGKTEVLSDRLEMLQEEFNALLEGKKAVDTSQPEKSSETKSKDEISTDKEEKKEAPIVGRDSWTDGNSGAAGGKESIDGRGSWGSNLSKNVEVEEHLKHVRQVMVKFMSKLPMAASETEELLPVLFSMLHFTKEETAEIEQERQKLTETTQNSQKAKKGGILGGFNKKRKR